MSSLSTSFGSGALAKVAPRNSVCRVEAPCGNTRPAVRGPFLFVGDRKIAIKAVTYGTFAADGNGDLFPAREIVREDFARMRGANINAIRTYTAPPTWLLEEARAAGLRVLAGIYWEGRNCAYDDPVFLKQTEEIVRDAVARLKAFPDVILAYIIGNEIPPLVARFHGRRTIERFCRRLYDAAKAEDPEGLVSYANYPSTEFLQLDFLDFYTLNVYLLEPKILSAYLDRMLIETKGKPLLLGEVGDDSIRRTEGGQAQLLDWTIPLALNKGACGVCIFSWTDDWVVGNQRVEDWAFGLVDARRDPKPAYEVARRRFGESPFAWREGAWPRVSVVVCNHNGAETLDETLSSLQSLDYPDYEIILVDDGSTDDSLVIAERRSRGIKVIRQQHQGLSAARNAGASAATGSIVAYIDSDAYADSDWLRFLVHAMDSQEFAGGGGPNLTPESDGLTAQLIACCPGNPTYVLKDNQQAEHVAGVNMAFRRDALLGFGGFDPVHTRAGDDVDICWRLEDAGLRLAFSPVAIVWHHRRPSIRRYLMQQIGYGEAENQLERKHPERFNLGGYIRWRGRVYMAPRSVSWLLKPFIHHGRFGTGLFQTLYQKEPSYLMDGPATIQWYMIWAAILLLSPLSLWLLPVGFGLLSLSLWSAFVAGLTTELPRNLTRGQRIKKLCTICYLHFLHPAVRWYGRLAARARHARPWRLLFRRRWIAPGVVIGELRHVGRRCKEMRTYWGPGSSEREEILRALHRELKTARTSVSFGQEWDNYDLSVNGGIHAEGRFYTAPEHFDQALCCGFKAYVSGLARLLVLSFTLGAVVATALDWRFVPLLVIPLFLVWRILGERAQLREKVWQTVDSLMARMGATRLGDTT